MRHDIVRPFVLGLALALAGGAAADKITTLKGLKKGAAVPAGQAALLIFLDRGVPGSAVKRPPPVTLELVAVADGKRYRVTDASDVGVKVAPPGKYFLQHAYTQDRSMELRDIHTAAAAFELKPDVLNYAGSWLFSNTATRNTGELGVTLEFAKAPLDEALKRHPQFAQPGKVWIAPFGQPTTMLGADAPAAAPPTAPAPATKG